MPSLRKSKNVELWDYGSHPAFFEYYAAASASEATTERFRSIQAAVLRIASQAGHNGSLDVADIGCGAGTQARLWAMLGHRVRGVDVNEPLISLARQRADIEALQISFEVASATALPWPDCSVDVCLLPELLEHVADWESCLRQAARVLRTGGILYVSTTNILCPVQYEFNLPIYSWYPGILKRHCERLAATTRPAIANYAKYPAVNWFSFYSLRNFLQPLGFQCLDRFDAMDIAARSALVTAIVRSIRHVSMLRFLGHVATPGTYVIAIKRSSCP